MSKQRFASVWDAIEDTPAQAENMRLRSRLMMALQGHIAHEDLTQSQAARLLGVTQPRISDLMRGKIDLFSLDTLVNMLACAGLHVDVRIAGADEVSGPLVDAARPGSALGQRVLRRRAGRPGKPRGDRFPRSAAGPG